MENEDKNLKPVDRLNARLDSLVENGMEKTRMYTSVFQENLRYFFSDQLAGRKKRKNWDWVVLNYIWPSAMQEIAKLSKNNPKINALPWNDEDADMSEAWESHLQWNWQDGINGTGMRVEQLKAILDKKIFGYCVSYFYWEPKVRWNQGQWQGDICHHLIHPAFFWADDEENVQNGNCGTSRYVDVDWAVSRWPKFEKEIREQATSSPESPGGGTYNAIRGQLAGGEDLATRGYGWPDNFSDLGNVGTSALTSLILSSDPMSARSSKKKVVKLEQIYFKDYEESEIKNEIDIPKEVLIQQGRIFQAPQGELFDTVSNEPVSPENWPKETQTVKEPKYPTGRYVLRVGKVILNEEDQVWPYSRWPFVVSPHYLIPHMWQGVDGVQLFKSTQDLINVTVSHLFNYMKTYGDPKWIVEDGAISSPPGKTGRMYRIGAAAGSVIRAARGALSKGKLKLLDPPQIPQGALVLYNTFVQEYKNIQGMQSIAKGEKTPGKMTAAEANWLATSSVDRIALQSVFEDAWIKECCKLIAEIGKANYELDRFVRIVGVDNIPGVQQISQRMKEIEFDIHIVPGTTLPYDEEKKLQKLTAAYQMVGEGTPNPMLPMMLKELEVPNWKKIIQQIPAFQQLQQLTQLREQVMSGKMTPQQATQIILHEAIQLTQQEGPQNAANQQGKQNNA